VENFIRAKAHYLRLGPLRTDPRAVVWGAGQIGRRLSKHLQRRGVDLIAFVDIDPRKIGSTRRGAPIISPDDLPDVHRSSGRPLILAAVPSRGARALIRTRLEALGLAEGREFLCVA
jgi:FlaA1/EpsC-like NDP-sugar epimerase